MDKKGDKIKTVYLAEFINHAYFEHAFPKHLFFDKYEFCDYPNGDTAIQYFNNRKIEVEFAKAINNKKYSIIVYALYESDAVNVAKSIISIINKTKVSKIIINVLTNSYEYGAVQYNRYQEFNFTNIHIITDQEIKEAERIVNNLDMKIQL